MTRLTNIGGNGFLHIQGNGYSGTLNLTGFAPYMKGLQMLANIAWVIFWAVTLFCSMTTAAAVINDRGYDETWEACIFLATPILWAIAIVFYFN